MTNLVFDGYPETRGRPRKHKNDSEKKKAYRRNSGQQLSDNVATLDFETEPFDNQHPEKDILPFAACFYTPVLGKVFFWNDDWKELIREIMDFLDGLEERYTIYAHNGGRFDFRFLMHMIEGKSLFMGTALMKAPIGKHELRDSLRILPMALKDYKKDDFDYSCLKLENRHKPGVRETIFEYMGNDCEYLYEMVVAFRQRFGTHLTVGQAGITELKKHYEFECLSERVDETLRKFFWGGRVECVQGRGHWKGDYKLYDRNSMYPAEMAFTLHPVGSDFSGRSKGGITEKTVFIDLTCQQRGAFPCYGDDGKLTFTKPYGRFFVTIHEFNAAIELDLISHIKFHQIIDCEKQTTFSDYILPLYEERFKWKAVIKQASEGSPAYEEAVRQDLLVKFLLNSSYGKFAWNPRNAKESYVRPRDNDLGPPKGFEDCIMPKEWNDVFEIWEKEALRKRYNNVATAASITGAARANLLRILHAAVDPIYCDTDSVICRDLPIDDLHPTRLGAWDLEAEFDEVVIAGKKLYACRKMVDGKPKDKVRAKGLGDMTFEEIRALVEGESVTKRRKGVTIARNGQQSYLERTAKSTVGFRQNRTDIFGRQI